METFVGDSVTITLLTSYDLTGSIDLKIKYRKPDLTTGSWDSAQCVGDVYSMEFETDESTLDQAGTWKLQAYAEFPGNVYLHGKWAELKVYNPIC